MSEKLKDFIIIVLFAIVNSYCFYMNLPFFGIVILLLYAYFKVFISLGKEHKAKMHLLYICTSNLAFYPDRGDLFMLFLHLEKNLIESKSFENDIITIEKFRFNILDKSLSLEKQQQKIITKILRDLDRYLELKYFFCKQRIKILHRRKLKEILNA